METKLIAHGNCAQFFLKEYLIFRCVSMLLKFFSFEPTIILRLFVNIGYVGTSENQRTISKFSLMFCFIIKQNKSTKE